MRHLVKLVFVFVFVLACGLPLSSSHAASKQAPSLRAKLIEEVHANWRKTYKADLKVNTQVLENLKRIKSANQLLVISDLEQHLRASLKQIRAKALEELKVSGEKSMPYLIRHWILATRDQLNIPAGLSSESTLALKKEWSELSEAIEDAITAVGLKAIPALTKVQGLAAEKKVSEIINKVEPLVTRIIKQTSQTQEKLVSEHQEPAKTIELHIDAPPPVDWPVESNAQEEKAN